MKLRDKIESMLSLILIMGYLGLVALVTIIVMFQRYGK
jgi:hypothetical protein